MGCIEDSTPALAAYRIALHYGLNVVEGHAASTTSRTWLRS